MIISYELIRTNVRLLILNIVCKDAALSVPPVYIPDMMPPISAPSSMLRPKSIYPHTTAMATDKMPLKATFICLPASELVNLHPYSIIGMASGMVILGSISWNSAASDGLKGRLPYITPMAYSSIIGPILSRNGKRRHSHITPQGVREKNRVRSK